MPAKKTWQEKLNDSKCYPKVEQINGKMTRKWGKGTLVIQIQSKSDQLNQKRQDIFC